MLRMLASALLFCTLSAHAQQYDLVLRNGHVIDPKNNVDAQRDVAIRDGKIAAIDPSIPASAAKQSIDITGLYLTPGLVDIHVHVFTGLRHNAWGNGDLSLPPDPMSIPYGVTTVADAGSSGWRDFPEFRRRVIDTSRTRVFAFVNIIGTGMANTDDAAEQTSSSASSPHTGSSPTSSPYKKQSPPATATTFPSWSTSAGSTTSPTRR
jgi:dihydroorotase